MSYLRLPQINFGGTAYCNPSTADNNDTADIFDVDTLQFKPVMTPFPGSTVVHPAGQQTFPYQGAADSPDCRTWIMGLLSGDIDDGNYGQQAHWNYYGDHATRLDDTTVKSVTPRPGVVIPADDPLLTATVSLIGTPSPMQFQDPVIVDNDPYALITSQIYSYGIQVMGKDASGNPVTLISANPTTRAYAYYINGRKNLDPNAKGFQGVSAIFLLSVPNGPGLTINTGINSPALNDLAAAAAQGTGLQMRFVFYDALYKISPQDLYAQFATGQYTANPYIGLNLGTIGVLAVGDMPSAPPDRKLNLQTAVPYTLSEPCGVLGGKNTGAANLGITMACFDMDAETVTLDCISTFPECNKDTNTKYNFGQMTLDLITADGIRIVLGTIPYDQATYETYAGLVTIPFGSNPQVADIKSGAATGSLVIHSVLNGDVLVESSGLDIETEDRAIYFDAQTLTNWSDPSEQPLPGTSQITVKAFRFGQPVQESVTVNLEHWMCDKNQINPSKPMVNVPSRYFTIAGAVEIPAKTYPNPNYNPNQPVGPNNEPTISVITDQVTIPANSNGELTLNLTALRPGTSELRFVDPTQPQTTPGFVWDNCNYSCIRILPFDDFRLATDEEVSSWPFIYANFFNYFSLLYPIMSRVIPWGPTDAPNSPDLVKQFAGQMKVFTNPLNWNTTIYMPITRDLSAGKRALLWRWCTLQGA